MFGVWRTLLAIEVVAFHLLLLPFIGAYAVFSFFVLSGFLMTAIAHDTYGYGADGLRRYLINRALRLFPGYWFALLVSISLIAAYGADSVRHYHAAIAIPQTLTEWLENLLMIFPAIVPRDVVPRLVPLAWALTVEIIYYLMIGLGLSRTRLTTLLWLVASLAYVAFATTIHHPRDEHEILPIYQYSAIPAGSLPFAVGATVWHWRDTILAKLTRIGLADGRRLIAIRWSLYLAIVVAEKLLASQILVIAGNWLNTALSGLIVCALFFARPMPRWRVIDKAVGDFSYPIYLLHLQMGLVAAMLLFGKPVTGRSLNSIAVFCLALVLTIMLGAISARLIDPAVERLRTRIKKHPPSPAARS